MACSIITTRSLNGQIKGLRDIPARDRPPLVINFYSFRVMIAAGFGLFFLDALDGLGVAQRKAQAGKDRRRKSSAMAVGCCYPGELYCNGGGVDSAGVGRQPWVLYGLMRTNEGASRLPAPAVFSSLLVFSSVYALLLILFSLFAWIVIKKGPDMEGPIMLPGRRRG